jgi:hypothetical protein
MMQEQMVRDAKNAARARRRGTAQLGELVAAIFDGAARQCVDPSEATSLAVLAVERMLLRERQLRASPV